MQVGCNNAALSGAYSVSSFFSPLFFRGGVLDNTSRVKVLMLNIEERQPYCPGNRVGCGHAMLIPF